ncbi:MAG: iron chelate uptake ABC transporter family permease subunit [Sarcina sp.]
MGDKKKLFTLIIFVLGVIILFLFQGITQHNFNYLLYRRIPKIVAMVITAVAIAFSTIIFQTTTNNKILTPSTLGLDSLYNLSQTFIIFLLGSSNIMMTNSILNFAVNVVVMMFNSLLLYKFVLRKNNDIFILLLVGTILGTLFRSMSTFMQVMIDPNEYDVLQNKLFASFDNINTDILIVVIVICLIIFASIYDDIKKFDVLLLGKDNAKNLGIDYEKMSKKVILIVSILMAISTALVGPITFLGLLVANLSYQFIKSYKHSYVISGAILISILALVGGQFLVERLFNYNSTVSIIINFIGGVYFIYLLLRENKI